MSAFIPPLGLGGGMPKLLNSGYLHMANTAYDDSHKLSKPTQDCLLTLLIKFYPQDNTVLSISSDKTHNIVQILCYSNSPMFPVLDTVSTNVLATTWQFLGCSCMGKLAVLQFNYTTTSSPFYFMTNKSALNVDVFYYEYTY